MKILHTADLHLGRRFDSISLDEDQQAVLDQIVRALLRHRADGLADVVESSGGRVRLDTIFIDEGFGSLDTENGTGTLDQVLRVLSALVSQNRAVGLISHVPQVQEAIPAGFYVQKALGGSLVETRAI